MKKLALILAALSMALLLPLTSCSSGDDSEDDNVSVTGITIAGENGASSLVEGTTLQLTATVAPTDATDKSVSWSSSDKTKATVNDSGLVQAVAVGETTITAVAKDGSKVSGTLTVTVTAAPVAATGIVVTSATSSSYLLKESTVQLYATVSPENATDKTVSWTSGDDTKATVNQTTGVVTGVAAGSVTITATSNSNTSITGEITIIVQESVVNVTSITVAASGDATTLAKDATLQLTAAVAPTDATDKSVTWSSGNESVATVDSSTGVVTGVSSGDVVITATAHDGSTITGTYNLTIFVPVSTITISAEGGATSIASSETLQLTAAVTPEDAKDKTVAWSSSDETIATVDNTGLVTASKAGNVTITAIAKDGSGVKGEYSIAFTAALPILPKGNSMTKIDGAGIMVYLDNTDLAISETNATSIISSLAIAVTNTNDSSSVTYTSAQFDDYGTNTVRLYIILPAAYANLSVAISGTINNVVYSGTAVFKNNVYQFDYTPTAIEITPTTKELKPNETVTFTVKETTYNMDITDKCTFTLTDTDSTGSSMSGAVFTAGVTNGKTDVYATYDKLTTSHATITVNSNALPTVMSTSIISGAGIQVYISKDVIATTPAKDDITITGTLATTDSAYTSYVSDNLTLVVQEVNDQGTATRIYFTQPNGFPDGKAITETFVIKWTGYTVNLQFNGNALTSSSIVVE